MFSFKFKRTNIFTLLMAVSVFAVVFRLVDIAQFKTPVSIAETKPPAEKFEKADTAEKEAPAHAATEKKPEEKAAVPAVTPSLDNPPPYGEQSFSAAEVEVLQSLAKRRDEINKREQGLIRREAVLKAAGGEVDKKIAELNKIKTELVDLLNKQKTLEDERITSLVKIYENMKPKEAARIFDTLEMDVLLTVIAKMSERKISPILAGMNPDRARQVTIQLAEQRKLPDAAKKEAAAPSPAVAPAPVTPPGTPASALPPNH